MPTPNHSPDWSAPRNPLWCRWARQRSRCHQPGRCGSLIPRVRSRCRRNRQPYRRGSSSAQKPSHWQDWSAQDMSGPLRCCRRCQSGHPCSCQRHPCHPPAHPSESQGRLEPRHRRCRSRRRLRCHPCRHCRCRPLSPNCRLPFQPCRRCCCQPRRRPQREYQQQPEHRQWSQRHPCRSSAQDTNNPLPSRQPGRTSVSLLHTSAPPSQKNTSF